MEKVLRHICMIMCSIACMVLGDVVAYAVVGDTAYFSTVLNKYGKTASSRKRRAFVSAQRMIDKLNSFKTSDNPAIFKQYVAESSENLRRECVLVDGRNLTRDTVSHELERLGVVLRGTREYIDAAYKQYLIEQVVSLPESDAKNKIMILVEKMPFACSKSDLLAQIDSLPSSKYSCKSEMLKLVQDLSEWCDGKEDLPSSNEIKRTFGRLSEYFYGSRFLKVAKFIIKSKLFWTATIGVALLNPWIGPLRFVFFRKETALEKTNRVKKSGVGVSAVADQTKTFRRGQFRLQFPFLTMGADQEQRLRAKSLAELLGITEVANKFDKAVTTLQSLRIRTVIDPQSKGTGFLAESLAGVEFQLRKQGDMAGQAVAREVAVDKRQSCSLFDYGKSLFGNKQSMENVVKAVCEKANRKKKKKQKELAENVNLVLQVLRKFFDGSQKIKVKKD